MTWHSSIQAVADYGVGTANIIVAAPKTLHRRYDAGTPTQLINLEWTYIGSMVRESLGTEWGPVIAGAAGSRICGLKDGWWYRSIWRIAQRHIDAAHRVWFQSCRQVSWRFLSVGTGAYTLLGNPVAMYPVIRHFAAPGGDDPTNWWSAASLPPFTFYRVDLPTVGAYAISSVTPVAGGLPEPDSLSPDNVDMTTWREQVYLRDGADAYVICEPNFYGAAMGGADSLSVESEPAPGTAGNYFLELDGAFDPAFLLGGISDAESFET